MAETRTTPHYDAAPAADAPASDGASGERFAALVAPAAWLLACEASAEQQADALRRAAAEQGVRMGMLMLPAELAERDVAVQRDAITQALGDDQPRYKHTVLVGPSADSWRDAIAEALPFSTIGVCDWHADADALSEAGLALIKRTPRCC